MCSFLILSFIVTPRENLSNFFSATSICLSCLCVIAAVSSLYIVAGLTIYDMSGNCILSSTTNWILCYIKTYLYLCYMFARETKRRLAEAEAALGRLSDSQLGGKRQPGESERDTHDDAGERERWGRMRVDDLRETEGRRHETAIPRSASANDLSVAGKVPAFLASCHLLWHFLWQSIHVSIQFLDWFVIVGGKFHGQNYYRSRKWEAKNGHFITSVPLVYNYNGSKCNILRLCNH